MPSSEEPDDQIPPSPSFQPPPFQNQPNLNHRTSFSASMNETPSNPLYLHHVENPGTILVSQSLLGTHELFHL